MMMFDPGETGGRLLENPHYAREASHTQGACSGQRSATRSSPGKTWDAACCSENPHLRARFQIVHRRRDERRKVLAWRGRALSGYRLPSDGSFTRPLTPAAATSLPHRTSTRRRLRHHRDSTSPQPPGPQAPPRETID
ncbi:hypothetical protein MRX96_002179 [Rhipicephalus microplus]